MRQKKEWYVTWGKIGKGWTETPYYFCNTCDSIIIPMRRKKWKYAQEVDRPLVVLPKFTEHPVCQPICQTAPSVSSRSTGVERHTDHLFQHSVSRCLPVWWGTCLVTLKQMEKKARAQQWNKCQGTTGEAVWGVHWRENAHSAYCHVPRFPSLL